MKKSTTKSAKTITKNAATPQSKQSERKAASKGKLGSLLGHSVISVVRAMGKHGWDFEQAQAALKKAGITAKEFTVKRALKRGANNDKTRRIAPITAKELETLKG